MLRVTQSPVLLQILNLHFLLCVWVHMALSLEGFQSYYSGTHPEDLFFTSSSCKDCATKVNLGASGH